MKICVFVKPDFIGGIAYNPGDIAGWPDHIADRLIAKDFAKLYGDGKPKVVDTRIKGAKDYWDAVQLEEHVDALKRDGWKPSPPVIVRDFEVERAARERMRDEMNQF